MAWASAESSVVSLIMTGSLLAEIQLGLVQVKSNQEPLIVVQPYLAVAVHTEMRQFLQDHSAT